MPNPLTTPRRTRKAQVALHTIGLALMAAAVGLAGAGVFRDSVAEAATTTVIVGQTNGGGATGVTQFNSATITVTRNDTVTWNSALDAKAHDVWSAVVPAGAAAFNSPMLKSGTAATTFSATLSVDGVYTYYCDLHSSAAEATLANVDANIALGKMVGKITVNAPAAPTATPVVATATPTATTAPGTATPTATTPAGATATPTASATTPPTSTTAATATPTHTATPTPPPPAAGDIQIIDFAFSPTAFSVAPGSSVRWVNAGVKPPTVTANDGSFDSGLMAKGIAYSHTFSTSGSYQYYCDLHPDMVGTITVGTGTGGAAPTATPTATPAPPPPAVPGSVQIIDYDYSPKELSVAPGASVRFLNVGAKKHTVTATDGSFDSGLMSAGDAYSHTFNSAGSFQYYCDLHPDMVGTVTVSDSASAGGSWPALPGIPDSLLYNEEWNRKTGTYSAVFVSSLAGITSGNSAFWGLILQGVQNGTIDAADLPPQIISFVESQYSRLGGPPATFHAKKPAPTPTPAANAPPAPPKVPGTAGSAGDVQVIDFDYSPRTISVKTGASVRFVNSGVARHTVTALDESFDSGFMAKGDAYSRTFTTPGTFDYFCIIHPDMVGSVQVSDGTGEPAPPATAAPRPVAPVSPPPPAAPGEVQMLDFSYSPRTITVNAGGSVRFVNFGVAPHTVTAFDGSFDSGFMSKGDAYRHTLPTPGTYEYFCVIHPNMTGSVRVLDASGSAPPALLTSPTSGATPGAAETQATGPATLQMADFAFEPRSLTVKPGTEVSWRNTGRTPHTVTARDNSFDSGLAKPGESFTRRFDAVGTFVYFCTLHPGMEGTILVSDTAAVAAAAPLGAAGTSGQTVTPGSPDSSQLGTGHGSDETLKYISIIIGVVMALTALVTLPIVVFGRNSSTAGDHS